MMLATYATTSLVACKTCHRQREIALGENRRNPASGQRRLLAREGEGDGRWTTKTSTYRSRPAMYAICERNSLVNESFQIICAFYYLSFIVFLLDPPVSVLVKIRQDEMPVGGVLHRLQYDQRRKRVKNSYFTQGVLTVSTKGLCQRLRPTQKPPILASDGAHSLEAFNVRC